MSNVFTGKNFVFTGTLQSISRQEAAKEIEALGGTVTHRIDKETNYLVSGTDPGSKFIKALQLRVPIMDEGTFLQLIA